MPDKLVALSPILFAIVASNSDLRLDLVIRVYHEREEGLLDASLCEELLNEEVAREVLLVGVGHRGQANYPIGLKPVKAVLHHHIGKRGLCAHVAIFIQADLIDGLKSQNRP